MFWLVWFLGLRDIESPGLARGGGKRFAFPNYLLNPTASSRLTNRLIEAQERSYWTPDAEMLAALRNAGEELEDRLEGIELAA